jgi:hypothetical protein
LLRVCNLTTELETCKNRLNNIESGINYDSTHHCALLTTIKHNETNNVDNSKPITKVLNCQRVERRTNKAPNQSSKSIKVKTKASTRSKKKKKKKKKQEARSKTKTKTLLQPRSKTMH